MKCYNFNNYREEKDGVVLEGNARFEGYSMDLITEIAKHLNFQFKIELVPGNSVIALKFSHFKFILF